MAVFTTLTLILLFSTVAFAIEENDSDIVFTMLVTRHGARSPTVSVPNGTTITKDNWNIYLGMLYIYL